MAIHALVRRGRQLWDIGHGYTALRGAQHGGYPEVRGRLVVRNRGALTIGYRLRADGSPLSSKLEVGERGELVIGDHAFLNYGVDINASHSVVIGDNVRVAPLVSIVDDPMHDVAPDRPRTAEAIVIGDNVWLGRGVTVLPGVTIGDHASIGAGSVVSRDVPARTVALGAPAVPVRELVVPDGWRRR